MTTIRKKANETSEQRDGRIAKEAVANHATRSEKTAWARKQANLAKYVSNTVNPLEEEIRDKQAELIPLYDKVNEMRQDMISSCIHPFDMLVNVGEHCLCRFCNKKLAKPVVAHEEE